MMVEITQAKINDKPVTLKYEPYGFLFIYFDNPAEWNLPAGAPGYLPDTHPYGDETFEGKVHKVLAGLGLQHAQECGFSEGGMQGRELDTENAYAHFDVSDNLIEELESRVTATFV